MKKIIEFIQLAYSLRLCIYLFYSHIILNLLLKATIIKIGQIKQQNLINQQIINSFLSQQMGQPSLCPCVPYKSDQLQSDLLPQKYKKYKQKPYLFILQRMEELNNQTWSAQIQQKYSLFLQSIGSHYNNVAYHNISHAFDVTTQVQAIDKYIVEYGMGQQASISSEQHVHILIAAYAHDNGHQGLTNNFYINSQDGLALKYSNLSPLEQMHSSNLLQCIRLHGIQVSPRLKQLMVSLILATDNKHHFELIKRVQQYQEIVNKRIIEQLDENYPLPDKQPEIVFRQTLLEMIMHTADVNSCGKPIDQYLKWNQRLYQEFSIQYRKENELQIKHSFQFDLSNWEHSVAKSNLGFFNSMILPLFKEVQVIMPKFRTQAVNALKIKQYYQAKIAKTQGKQKYQIKHV